MRLPAERELSEKRQTQSFRGQHASKGQKVEGKLRRRRARGVGGNPGQWMLRAGGTKADVAKRQASKDYEASPGFSFYDLDIILTETLLLDLENE